MQLVVPDDSNDEQINVNLPINTYRRSKNRTLQNPNPLSRFFMKEDQHKQHQHQYHHQHEHEQYVNRPELVYTVEKPNPRTMQITIGDN